MTTRKAREYRALILGDLPEVDEVFALEAFAERFAVESVHAKELDQFQEAIEGSHVDLILIDIAPYGLDVLDFLIENPPLRPVIMVAEPKEAPLIVEAKVRGLERYVIRLADYSMTIDLLHREILSVFEQLAPSSTLTYPTLESLIHFGQYHNVRQPFFVVDLYRRLLYKNEAGDHLVERLHGKRPDIGDSLETFYLDQSPERFEELLERAFHGEEVEKNQIFSLLDESTSRRQILYQPVYYENERILAVSIACKNVGALMRAEEKLQQQAQTLWGFFELAPLPLKMISEDLILERCNPAFHSLLGTAKGEQLRDHSIKEFVHPDDAARFSEQLERLFADEKAYIQADHRYCTRQGREVWVNSIGAVLGEEGNGPRRALLASVDITRQREAEQRAEQSMRMEAIGELAGGVAHDFNNVLAIISAIGYVIKGKLSQKGEDQLVEFVDKMQRAVDSGASLTHQLLSFSRHRKVEWELIDLNEHIEEIADLLRRAVGEEIEINVDLEPDPALIELGKGQLDQMIMNLAVNARDAMPEGGRLTIETRHLHIPPGQTPPWPDLDVGDWIVLEVSDEGVGMDYETRRRLFEPFYTTKRPGEGTGMGLATVYRIVDGAGGKIYVRSRRGEGTTFAIDFPAKEAIATEEEVTTTLVDELADAHVARILLVEDEDGIREPYRIFLEDVGFEVFEAADLNQAYQIVDDYGGAIDLLLTDVILPDGSGVDLAKNLREQFDDLKIIFMSGYAPDLISRSGEDLVAQWSFLPKPLSREKLLEAVAKTLEERVSR